MNAGSLQNPEKPISVSADLECLRSQISDIRIVIHFSLPESPVSVEQRETVSQVLPPKWRLAGPSVASLHAEEN